MNLISGLRERLTDTLHDAERAATEAAAKAKEAVSEIRTAVGSEAPAPSAASVEHAQSAAADAAKHAATKPAKDTKEMGVFAGFGASAAIGADQGTGGQVSAGYVVGAGGTMKGYGSTGVTNGALGASAGVGFEAGLVVGDVRDFYGEGHQLTIAMPGFPVAGSIGFDRDHNVTSISASAGKSVGGGVFQFDTKTEDTTGR